MTLPLVSDAAEEPAAEKPPIKTADKKPSNKMIKQTEKVLTYMKYGQEYQAAVIGELLGVKESRTKEILRWSCKNSWPELKMYADDHAHASEAGSDFAAKMIWESIYTDLRRNR